jgi:hypothetical protein
MAPFIMPATSIVSVPKIIGIGQTTRFPLRKIAGVHRCVQNTFLRARFLLKYFPQAIHRNIETFPSCVPEERLK